MSRRLLGWCSLMSTIVKLGFAMIAPGRFCSRKNSSFSKIDTALANYTSLSHSAPGSHISNLAGASAPSVELSFGI